MEVKKSLKADLEGKRKTGFLLGLIVALSIFIVLMEFNTRASMGNSEISELDDLTQDIEMTPLIQHKDMIPAEIPQQEPSLIDKINVVDVESSPKDDEVSLKQEESLLDEGISKILAIDLTEGLDDKSPIAIDENDNPLDFRVVERLPEFPGGMVEFMKWLTKTLKYPMVARQNEIQGKVIVSFIINQDGEVTSPKILQSVDPDLDREAMRVVRIMPKWKAGENKGKSCRTYMCLPIVFKL